MGKHNFTSVQQAYWFEKPSGMHDGQLYQQLNDKITPETGALGGRQMTLGPTAEFCWQSPETQTLPQGIEAQEIALTTIWNGQA